MIILLTELLLEIVYTTMNIKFSLRHDHYAVSQVFCFIHVVRAEQNCFTYRWRYCRCINSNDECLIVFVTCANIYNN